MDIKIAILDSLIDDDETIVQIQNYLRFLKIYVGLDDISCLIKSMLEEKLVSINEDISDNDFVWYKISEKGKEFWEKAT